MAVNSRIQNLMKMIVIDIEGGFAPPVRNIPMNLFGIIPQIWADEKGMSIEAAKAEMIALGRLLEPIGKSRQPASGMPLPSHARARDDISPAEKAKVASALSFAMGVFTERYVTEPGFDKFPPAIQPHLIDFSFNKNPPRARWALTEAMHNAGLLPESTYRKLPHLDAGEVQSGAAFGPKGAAAPFNYKSVNNLLLPHLANLTPAQLTKLVTAYAAVRIEFYEARVEDRPQDRDHLRGWVRRVNRISALSNAPALSYEMPAPSKPPSKPKALPSRPVRKSDPILDMLNEKIIDIEPLSNSGDPVDFSEPALQYTPEGKVLPPKQR